MNFKKIIAYKYGIDENKINKTTFNKIIKLNIKYKNIKFNNLPMKVQNEFVSLMGKLENKK